MKYIFLAKIKDSDDRDCVKYLDLDTGKFECNHYFSGLRISGACFSGITDKNKKKLIDNYNNLETILTKEEFVRLFDFDKNVNELGYCITKGDERYEKGLIICQSIQDIIDKLMSDENEQLFAKVIQDEKEYCVDKYSLTEKEVDEIFDNYGLDYQDRAIIIAIFKDVEECGEEEFDTYSEGQISDHMKQFVDYEAFGEDLVYNTEDYYKLTNGKVVYYAQ